jgi:hypothetical protein
MHIRWIATLLAPHSADSESVVGGLPQLPRAFRYGTVTRTVARRCAVQYPVWGSYCS